MQNLYTEQLRTSRECWSWQD